MHSTSTYGRENTNEEKQSILPIVQNNFQINCRSHLQFKNRCKEVLLSTKLSFSFQLLLMTLFALSSWNGTFSELWAFPKQNMSYFHPVFLVSSSDLAHNTHWKRLWCWEGLGQKEKGTTEDEMAGWHHWLNGRESEWTPGAGDGQGGLACCD